MNATDHLLGVIYEAALDPERWPEALAILADAAGGVGAHLVVIDKVAGAIGGLRPRLKKIGTRSMDPDAADRYMREWHVLDPLLSAAGHASGPPGNILLCHEFLSDDFVAHDMYFQDFLIPAGGRYQAGVTLENEQDRVAVLDLHSRDVPFTREQLRPLTSVIAHLGRAVHLSAVLADHLEREALLRTAIDGQGMVCLMVNAEGLVVDQSQAAEQMLAHGEGLRLDVDGKVGFGDEMRTRRLHALIADACHGRGGGEVPFAPPRLRPAVIRVVPTGVTCDNRFNLSRSNCALLFFEAPARPPSPDPVMIRLALGCSLAEAEVAAALARGRSPSEIAAERATSINTVRAQLRNLLDASGTHRLAELVAVIHGNLKASQPVA